MKNFSGDKGLKTWVDLLQPEFDITGFFFSDLGSGDDKKSSEND